MCDMCDAADRGVSREQYIKDFTDKLLDVGHSVMLIGGRPEDDPDTSSPLYPWAYSCGRTLLGKPEVIVTGTINHQVMHFMVNEACRLQDEEGFDLRPGAIFPKNTLLQGYEVYVVEASTEHLGFAEAVFGDAVTAVQLLWPDMQGNFPGNPQCTLEHDQQPIFTKEA